MEERKIVLTSELVPYVSALCEKLRELNYSTCSIRRMNSIWQVLLEYTADHPPEPFNESFRQRFIEEHYSHCMGDKYSSFAVTRALYMLSDYIGFGLVFRQKMNTGQPFSLGYRDLFESFLASEQKRNLAKGTLHTYASRLYKLEYFFISMGAAEFKDVTLEMLNRFLESLAGYSTTTVSEFIRQIRLLSDFAYANGYHVRSFSSSMPRVKNIRQQRLPSVFKPEEIKSMLESVDRDSPLGKRNYAMILLAARLGLRISDIRYLEFSSIDWGKKILSIVQKKTQKPLILPLLDDVGWAIIDYLKNGRPESDSSYVFIRHSPPYTALTGSSHLIVQQMRKAGIQSPLNRKIGMHALRHGLASSMLENGVSLPVITHTLGHSDIQSTEVYLRISMSQLKQCALEVV